MSKRILAFVLALALCLTCVSALAAGSKTTKDVVTTKNTEQPATEIQVGQPTAETKAILEEVAALINEGKSAEDYFGEDAKELKLDELGPLTSSAPITSATTLTVSTAASYSEGDKVAVLVGYMVNGKMVWKKLNSTIQNGKLVVMIPADIAAEISGGSVSLAVLSDKA